MAGSAWSALSHLRHRSCLHTVQRSVGIFFCSPRARDRINQCTRHTRMQARNGEGEWCVREARARREREEGSKKSGGGKRGRRHATRQQATDERTAPDKQASRDTKPAPRVRNSSAHTHTAPWKEGRQSTLSPCANTRMHSRTHTYTPGTRHTTCPHPAGAKGACGGACLHHHPL